MRFNQFFSLDSPKAIKARTYGYVNAINYMAPHRFAGVGDLCGNTSPGCIALCLGLYSGQAGMVKAAEAETALNAVRASRVAKAQMLMRDRKRFMAELEAGVERAIRYAARQGLNLCVRLNGATDLAWEGLAPWLFEKYANIQFVDYTKSKKRALACAAGKFPANYHLCFSRSELNDADCLEVLAAGGTVAVVSSLPQPTQWFGCKTVDGDSHDLRHLDPKSSVIWLKPKGLKAKRDNSGFVVKELA